MPCLPALDSRTTLRGLMRRSARRAALLIALVSAIGTNPVVVPDNVRHEHTASLAIRDGQLCVILHHSDGDHESNGISLDEADHELKLIDQHANPASVRTGSTDRHLIGTVATLASAGPSSVTRALLCGTESPPTPQDKRSTVLRI
jgi:hypothetical protein